MKQFCLRVLQVAVLLPTIVVSAPIYSTIDKNGNRVFSDAPSEKAAEVALKESTVVSGNELGKRVQYRYGQPDSGKGQWYGKTHPQLRELESRKQECADMKSLMDNSAGRIKINTENHYNKKCILGQ
jgi:hypothetical protein